MFGGPDAQRLARGGVDILGRALQPADRHEIDGRIQDAGERGPGFFELLALDRERDRVRHRSQHLHRVVRQRGGRQHAQHAEHLPVENQRLAAEAGEPLPFHPLPVEHLRMAGGAIQGERPAFRGNATDGEAAHRNAVPLRSGGRGGIGVRNRLPFQDGLSGAPRPHARPCRVEMAHDGPGTAAEHVAQRSFDGQGGRDVGDKRGRARAFPQVGVRRPPFSGNRSGNQGGQGGKTEIGVNPQGFIGGRAARLHERPERAARAPHRHAGEHEVRGRRPARAESQRNPEKKRKDHVGIEAERTGLVGVLTERQMREPDHQPEGEEGFHDAPPAERSPRNGPAGPTQDHRSDDQHAHAVAGPPGEQRGAETHPPSVAQDCRADERRDGIADHRRSEDQGRDLPKGTQRDGGACQANQQPRRQSDFDRIGQPRRKRQGDRRAVNQIRRHVAEHAGGERDRPVALVESYKASPA